MATNFGFMPVLSGKRYFISYKSEDSERVGEITRKLNEMGVPMWYDYGIEKGKRWSVEINRNIEECEAFILFATKTLFAAEDTWVRKEFRLADMSNKKKYVVWLDDVNPYQNPQDVHSKLKDWYLDVEELQGIKMAGCSVDQIAWNIVTEFHLIQGRKPQPPSPSYQPTAPKAEKPASVSQSTNPYKPSVPKLELKPASVSQPVSQPQPNPAVNSVPNKTQPAAAKSVKHTPLIVTVAIVLVAAIVCGIWARSNPAKSVKPLSELESVSVGDHFTFGNYPQGANGEVQPIEWRVLDVQGGKALVISEKLLDCVQYNESYTNVTWETCTLRKWMNDDFLNKAFTSNEQAEIATVTKYTPNNSSYGTSGGNTTQDKIFALSIDEAGKYFGNNDDRRAAPTEYAIKNGAWTSDIYSLSTGEKAGWWWLRSPGNNYSSAASVNHSGGINRLGLSVGFSKVAVRPAFWLNLS
ncbi:MAG: toll/interleukin-1 receptor domain-containing protein [Clostridia bacterium]|nr:toll/interleukin-1 receptor domain-containing protein [Clostridia bacterium]